MVLMLKRVSTRRRWQPSSQSRCKRISTAAWSPIKLAHSPLSSRQENSPCERSCGAQATRLSSPQIQASPSNNSRRRMRDPLASTSEIMKWNGGMKHVRERYVFIHIILRERDSTPDAPVGSAKIDTDTGPVNLLIVFPRTTSQPDTSLP